MRLGLTWNDYRWTKEGQILLDIPALELDGPGLVLLLGATGSGKTTLFRSLTGDLEHLGGGRVEGRVNLRRPPGGSGPAIGFLPQDASNAFLSFDAATEFAVREQALGVPPDRARVDARERAERLRLPPNLPHARLSGGERKRLALAAIQVGRPPFLLLDEPFNHLDATWRARLETDVLTAAKTSLVIVATHEPDGLLERASRAIGLRAGRLVFNGAPPEFHRRTELSSSARPGASRRPDRARPSEPLVVLERVTIDAGQRRLLDAASTRWPTGLHAIKGPNGSGKTTLLRALMGLHPVTSGTIRIAGQDTTRTATRRLSQWIAFHPEEPVHMFFRSSVREEMAVAPSSQGLPGCDVEARLREAASDFELDRVLERNPWSLSGGERERLALACLDAARTPVLLLDEPTHGLDAAGRSLLVGLIERRRNDACILLATHDSALIHLADTVHEIRDGRLVPAPGHQMEVMA